jgi:hypothetical protein
MGLLNFVDIAYICGIIDIEYIVKGIWIVLVDKKPDVF